MSDVVPLRGKGFSDFVASGVSQGWYLSSRKKSVVIVTLVLAVISKRECIYPAFSRKSNINLYTKLVNNVAHALGRILVLNVLNQNENFVVSAFHLVACTRRGTYGALPTPRIRNAVVTSYALDSTTSTAE